jgi:hypothetical protein
MAFMSQGSPKDGGSEWHRKLSGAYGRLSYHRYVLAAGPSEKSGEQTRMITITASTGYIDHDNFDAGRT